MNERRNEGKKRNNQSQNSIGGEKDQATTMRWRWQTHGNDEAVGEWKWNEFTIYELALLTSLVWPQLTSYQSLDYLLEIEPKYDWMLSMVCGRRGKWMEFKLESKCLWMNETEAMELINAILGT